MQETTETHPHSWISRHPEVALWSTFAAVKLIVHLICWHGYGVFRDELYFLDCGRHLDWGYVDHAPMVGWIAWLSQVTFGDSLFGLRFYPALAGATKVFLAGWMAREIGASRFAQGMTCLSFLIGPVFTAADSMLTIASIEQLFWMVCTCILIYIIKTGTERAWLAFGAVFGIGLMTKHSFVFFGAATVIALLLTPHCRYMLCRSFWIGGLIAALLALPNLLWQIANDWPTLGFMKALNQNSSINPVEFLLGQVLYHHVILLPIWFLGLFHFLRT
ncbi:MAG: glycosyltransferase family 39 protein, partial [bacterium]